MQRHVLNDLAYQRKIRRAIGREVREIMAHDGEPCEDEPDMTALPPLPPRTVQVKRLSVWRHIQRFFDRFLFI